jgi:carboxymethylenebutenolidase
MRSVLALALLWPLTGADAQTQRPAAETVAYRAGKETVKAVYCRPPGKGPFPAVVVIHGDFGPTPWVKQQARRLAEKGYVALAVDLYRGELPKTVEEAHILDRGLPEDRVLADLKGAVDHLAGLPDVNKDRVGVLGWDMGGGYALDAALRDRRLRAVVICYGRLTTDPALLRPLEAPVLGIFAGKDEGITPETIKRFGAAMRKAGKRLAGAHVYPECDNGFLDPTSPHAAGKAPAAAVADAWGKIDAFLAAELKKQPSTESRP